MDDVFAALASAPRRRILASVSQIALTTTELAERLRMTPPAVSRHLAVLLAAGVVASERQGQKVLYRLERDALIDALSRFAAELDAPLRRVPREAL